MLLQFSKYAWINFTLMRKAVLDFCNTYIYFYVASRGSKWIDGLREINDEKGTKTDGINFVSIFKYSITYWLIKNYFSNRLVGMALIWEKKNLHIPWG